MKRKTVVALILVVMTFCCSLMANDDDLNITGSYRRSVFGFHIYSAFLETDSQLLLELLDKGNDGKASIEEINKVMYQEELPVRLTLIMMTDQSDARREKKSLIETFDRMFKSRAQLKKDLKADIERYIAKTQTYLPAREKGDQIVLDIRGNQGFLEFIPFSRESKQELINKLKKEVDQLAHTRDHKQRNKVKDIKKLTNEISKFGKYSRSQEEITEFPIELIRSMISTYTNTSLCSLSGMPKELLTFLSEN